MSKKPLSPLALAILKAMHDMRDRPEDETLTVILPDGKAIFRGGGTLQMVKDDA